MADFHERFKLFGLKTGGWLGCLNDMLEGEGPEPQADATAVDRHSA